MNKQIKNILNDLYAVDESLKLQESELIKIIEKLLVSRPNTKFDKKFARKFRAELLQNKKVNYNLINNLTNMFTMKQFTYAGAGVAVIILAVFVWQGLSPDETRFAFAPNITKVGDQAFGSLINIDDNSASQLGQPEAMGIGAGGGGGTTFNAVRSESGDGENMAMVNSKMMMPNPYSVNYKFIYEGDELSIDEEKMAVLKRIKDQNVGRNLAQSLKGFDFGDINLNKFSNLTLQSISLAEDKDFGYSVHINPLEGVFSIGENYTQWQEHRPVCRDQKCYEDQRLKPSDMPADEVLIKIADTFFKSKEIDISNYGEPEIRKDWLMNARPSVEIYTPDRVSIIYPLIINDQKIYEENGYLAGMNVSVDIRLNKVTNMHYMTQDYQSSDYETETDVKRILKFAEQGGRYTRRYFAPTETKELKIGTPTLEYVKIWQFNEDKRENAEILVPAYVFPIIEKPEGTYFWQERIIIPIIKELLDEADKRNNDIGILPEPRPMPLEKPVSSSDTSVSIDKEDIDE